MIEITVRDRERKVLGATSKEGNQLALFGLCSEKYPLLSNLDAVSYDVFDRSDAPNLILELRQLREECSDDADLRDHLDSIIRLLLILANTEGATVMFSPFSEEN